MPVKIPDTKAPQPEKQEITQQPVKPTQVEEQSNEVNLEFTDKEIADVIVPESIEISTANQQPEPQSVEIDDDISNSYMLARQVQNEYHSPAIQDYLDQKQFKQRLMQPSTARQDIQLKEAERQYQMGLTKRLEKIEGEYETEPWIDPTAAFAGGFGSVARLSVGAGMKLMPALGKALTAGIAGAIAEYPIGLATEKLEEVAPQAAMPFNVAVGLISGATLETAIEKGLAKAVGKGSKIAAELVSGNITSKLGQEAKIKIQQALDFVHSNPQPRSFEDVVEEVRQAGKLGRKMPEIEGLPDDKQRIIQDAYESGHSAKSDIIDEAHDAGISGSKQPDTEGLDPDEAKAVEEAYQDGLDIRSETKTFLEQEGPGYAERSGKEITQISEQAGEVGKIAKKERGVPGTSEGQVRLRYNEKTSQLVPELIDNSFLGSIKRIVSNQRGEIKIERKAKIEKVFSEDLNWMPELKIRRNKTGDVLLADNVNIDRIESTENIAEAIARTSTVFKKEITAAKRGKITNDATQSLADHCGMTVETLLKRRKGEAFNAEQALAARNILVASAENILQLARKVKKLDATTKDKFALRKAMNTHYAIQAQVSGATAEAGRALQSFNIKAKSKPSIKLEREPKVKPKPVEPEIKPETEITPETKVESETVKPETEITPETKVESETVKPETEITPETKLESETVKPETEITPETKVEPETVKPETEPEFDEAQARAINDLLENTPQGISIEDLAEKLLTLDSPEKVSKMVKDVRRVTSFDMFTEVWINGFLSSAQTHVVNILSNSLTALYMVPERMFASGIGRLFNETERIKIGEVSAQVHGMVEGFKDGLKAFAYVIKTGEPTDIATKIENQRYKSITAANVAELPLFKKLNPAGFKEGGPIAQGIDLLGEFVRLPGRGLTAGDELFKAIGYRMELRSQAYRIANQEGLTGEKFAKRVAEILQDPENLAPNAHLASINAARYQTFTNELGAFGKSLQKTVNTIPALKLIVPFIRTPLNILKFATARSPLAFLSKAVRADIAAGGVRRDMALARIGLGSCIMATSATMAANGLVTGGGPKDPKKKAALYREGWQPYSFKIGDKYIAYNRLEPIGMLFGAAADFAEISGLAGEEVRPDVDELGSALLFMFSKNVTSKTWMSGVSRTIQALEDPDRYGERFLQNYAGSLIPSFVAQVERAVHPEMQVVDSYMDAIRARIPGLSDDLPTRKDLWGNEISLAITKDRGWADVALSMVNPFYVSEEKRSAIDEEMFGLGVFLSKPPKLQTFPTSLGNVKIEMTPKTYDEFIIKMNEVKLHDGRKLKDSLDYLVTKDKNYQTLSNEQKETVIRSHYLEARELTKLEMLKDESFKAKLEKILADQRGQ